MKIINSMTPEEKKLFVNELIVSCEISSKESISIELLKFLRRQEMKIENTDLFNELHDIIEKKFF